MPQFKSALSFVHFSSSVRYHCRYARTADTEAFLSALADTAEARSRDLPSDSTYWRAQLGVATVERKLEDADANLTVYTDVDVPFPAERMVPLRHAAQEGRVNPKGIPCLYLATDKETAMSEIRPWLGAKLSVAIFRTERALRIVDCSIHHDSHWLLKLPWDNPSPEQITEAIWAQVDEAFSEPITDDVATAAYAPTQVIAEAFRQRGFDGVVYRSKLGPGFNLALFDLDCAKPVVRRLFKTTRVAFEFAEEQTS